MQMRNCLLPASGFRVNVDNRYPVEEEGRVPLMRSRDSFWKRWRIVLSSSSPDCLARALPSFWICSIATLCHLPSVSAARGMKLMPCCLQGSPDLATFLLKYPPRA